MSVENMKLWDAVSKTDPAMTKHVNQRGGFTAICAQYQKRLATEQWGPYGTAWGLSSLLFGYVHDAAGEVIELTLDAEFHYPGGRFPISADIKYRAGDDCRKKVRTDAMTKALSDLGFNSDVFEGKFDDNKYVNQRRQEEAQPPPKPVRQAGASPSDLFAKVQAKVEAAANDPDKLKDIFDKLPQVALAIQDHAVVYDLLARSWKDNPDALERMRVEVPKRKLGDDLTKAVLQTVDKLLDDLVRQHG